MKLSLPLLPGMDYHKSLIYLDRHWPTFPVTQVSWVRGKRLYCWETYCWNQKWIKKGASRINVRTRIHSSLGFPVRTLSPEGIWITYDLVGFPILCLSRQDVALVDFIVVSQITNCQCWVFMGISLCLNVFASGKWLWLLSLVSGSQTSVGVRITSRAL